MGGKEMARDLEQDKRTLAEALRIVRKEYPEAVSVTFETSDQNHYGFAMLSMIGGDGIELEPFNDITDRVDELVCDIDWNGVMNESKQGYATIDLREWPSPEPEISGQMRFTLTASGLAKLAELTGQSTEEIKKTALRQGWIA